MAARDTVLTPRRLTLAAVLFGLFVVCDVVLFGWLILKSLSQREIEKVLLETREEVEPVAADLAARAESLDQDLWVVVSVAEETRTYFNSLLRQREVVRTIEIRDRDGTVVYHHTNTEATPLGNPPFDPPSDSHPSPPGLEEPEEIPELPVTLPRLGLEEVEVPIGDVGTLVVGLSEAALGRRVSALRRELIRQTSWIGVLTAALLAVAFTVIGMLFRRARRLAAQARESERLAYVGTLAAGLAHELRNPLNSLRLNMQMLEEETQDQRRDGHRRRLLALTRSEITRLEHLVTDFLAYARPRPLELGEVPAVALVEQAAEVLGGEIRARRAEVTVDDRSAGARVRVDRAQMLQLLINLLHNALAATAESDRLPRVQLVVGRRPQEVVFEVIDNGCGIPDEDRERIFDLFFSTRKGGTGLGLAIVQRIASSHGARIEVDSTPGAGTTVRVWLPVAAATND